LTVSRIEVGFTWTRGARYEPDTVKGTLVIRQIGKQRQTYRPRETELSNLHLRFAELDYSPEAFASFATDWGLLEKPAAEDAMESVEGWRREVRKMKGSISMFALKAAEPGGVLRLRAGSRFGVQFKATTIDVLLLSAEGGARPTMVLQPPNLLNAIWLQLATAVAGGNSIRACAECNRWFHTGIGDKVRRSVAIFCSEECKNRHHYKTKRKAKS
jgi:hypothetical protein